MTAAFTGNEHSAFRVRLVEGNCLGGIGDAVGKNFLIVFANESYRIQDRARAVVLHDREQDVGFRALDSIRNRFEKVGGDLLRVR